MKSVEQQLGLMLHRTRELFARQRTMLVNSLRGQLSEFGLIAPKGVWSIPELHALAQGASRAELPDAIRGCVELMMGQIDELQMRIQGIEKTIRDELRVSDVGLRLKTIPGICVITASALTATIGDIEAFKSVRHLAAWIGLVPRQSGSGDKVYMGKISKKGDAYLRKFLVLGATAVIRYCRSKPELAGWINALLQRRPARVVTVAVASKMARIAWAIMSPGESFRQAASVIA